MGVKKAALKQALYEANRDVYEMLRYGVNVSPEAGSNKTTVRLINWERPPENDFAFAEEVSIRGVYAKRPDIVLYVNGIALGVLELKRSISSIHEGIRQNLDNQKDIFIKPFFATIQLIMAGTNNQGIAYGTTETKEKYYLHWKEVNPQKDSHHPYLLAITEQVRILTGSVDFLLDKDLISLLNKERFCELIHDFIVFDRGKKKIARHNQYFGVKAAREYVRDRQGGIIWHTQGSGKSLTMVWLTKWIYEHMDNARVLIITDRTELDDQIEKVYLGVSEKIYRTKSGKDLIQKLNNTVPWLLCSLIQKFGNKEEPDEADIDAYIRELRLGLLSGFSPKGNIYVFVDECHRTQSGKLHAAMKELLPEALFIGFTGTPLLKKDKTNSMEVFGPYIHTYKFDEGVRDNIILDLRYEARDIEQHITSMDKVDEWFELKTKGLTDYAKAELKQKWGTIKKIFSSKSRLEKIVADIMLDMAKKERLQNGRGIALLISGSVYNACRFYELFQQVGLKECAIVTSFAPSIKAIKGEETGEGRTEKIIKYDIYKKMLGGKDIKTFEKDVKKIFVDEPGRMKLLIVVNKLLTGFDAPSATYLYIDKKMKDHGLFQAICRVNRLDTDDKEYGYIIDYKDLFKSLGKSIHDYTSGAFDGYDKKDITGLLTNRLEKGAEKLEEALERVRAICEPVEPPKKSIQYHHYFAGRPEYPDEIKNTEPRRFALYKGVIALIRSYAAIADEMEEAGYTPAAAADIKREVRFYDMLRKEIMIASYDYIDLKQYEPAMRYLIDSYLGAEESRVLANFDDMSLVELIVENGEKAFMSLPRRIRENSESMAETIENNLRRVISGEMAANPAYYEKMSILLDELISLRKDETLEYQKYLEKIIELTRKVKKPASSSAYPSSLDTNAKRALYDNTGGNEKLALELDRIIMSVKRDRWRETRLKTREVALAIQKVLDEYEIKEPSAEHILEIVKIQRDY